MSKIKLNLGSYSEGLISPRDVFTFLLALLINTDEKFSIKFRNDKLIKSLENSLANGEKDINIDKLQRANESLIKILNKYVPPFTYFGRHPTDSYQLGVWIDLGKLHAAEDNGQLTQIVNGNWKKGIKSTYILGINDSGALTLYLRWNKKEVWTMN